MILSQMEDYSIFSAKYKVRYVLHRPCYKINYAQSLKSRMSFLSCFSHYQMIILFTNVQYGIIKKVSLKVSHSVKFTALAVLLRTAHVRCMMKVHSANSSFLHGSFTNFIEYRL